MYVYIYVDTDMRVFMCLFIHMYQASPLKLWAGGEHPFGRSRERRILRAAPLSLWVACALRFSHSDSPDAVKAVLFKGLTSKGS